MKTVSHFPRQVREIMTVWIPMPDGIKLAARIWLPEDAEANPVPAILEYLPYRRRDGTSYRDSMTQPYIAGHGYAAVRVDIRGSGDSEGVLLDEYDTPELNDGVAVIAWLAAQPWCSGPVGMWGISWGGTNSLQIAALQPPALKAIMPMGFMHDLYNGDCHYIGGCLLEGNTSWGGTFLAGNLRPPDPAVVGERWRDMWMERLQAMTLPVQNWLTHQRRDDYWKSGSVCEAYSRIQVPVYAINGWQDSYARNVLPLLEGLSVPRKALIGPWAHAWPHLGQPGPAIGFLQEALRWWDHWLKGIDTGIMDEPMLRVWMQDWLPPAKQVAQWPGRWVAETHWPTARIESVRWPLQADGGLSVEEGRCETLSISSPQDTGLMAGYQCSYALGPDLSDDQRPDDKRSLCFDSEPLTEALEILGEPRLELELSCDRPLGMVAVRLCDVAPDGSSLRVSYGLLNLAHADGPEHPKPMQPGVFRRVVVPLCGAAARFPAGHRVRVAISTTYWPIAWPSPEVATLSLRSAVSALVLPVRPARTEDAALLPFEEPQAAPAQTLVEIRPRHTKRSLDRIERDPTSGSVDVIRERDRGAWRTLDTDVDYDTQGELRFSIHPDDPLSAEQSITLDTRLGREGWRVRTHASTTIRCTVGAFLLSAKVEAWDGQQRVFERDWNLSLPRDNL